MHQTDYLQFKSEYDDLCALYGKPATDKGAIIYFQALQAHELSVVIDAIQQHIKDPLQGQQMPLPAHLIGKIEQNKPKGDELLGWMGEKVETVPEVALVLSEYCRVFLHSYTQTGSERLAKEQAEEAAKLYIKENSNLFD